MNGTSGTPNPLAFRSGEIRGKSAEQEAAVVDGDDLMVLEDQMRSSEAASNNGGRNSRGAGCWKGCCWLDSKGRWDEGCCYRRGICGNYLPSICSSPIVVGKVVAVWAAFTILMNFLCEACTATVFYGMSAGFRTIPTLIVLIVLFASGLCAFRLLKRRKGHGNLCFGFGGSSEDAVSLNDVTLETEMRTLSGSRTKKGAAKAMEKLGACNVASLKATLKAYRSYTGFVLLYLIIFVVILSIGNVMVYPGAYSYLPAEVPLKVEIGRTMTFSGGNGDILKGYEAYYVGGEPVMELPDGIEATYPVIMYGGNGGSSWYNVGQGGDFFTKRKSESDAKLAFHVFSFSYRGYDPNSEYSMNELSTVHDGVAFFEHVQGLYPGTRPMVFSHSLGTGVASYVAQRFNHDQMACLTLGMPLSSMWQTVLEYSFYAPLFWMTAFDPWPSEKRIKEMGHDVPLVVLSGGKDEVIAPHHQAEMYKAAASTDKLFLFEPNAHHMGIRESIWDVEPEKYDEFFEKCISRSSVQRRRREESS